MKKLKNGVIKIKHKHEDGLIAYWGDGIPACDIHLLFYYMANKNINYKGGELDSMLDELESRGYDLNTLKFEIKKKDRVDEQ